MILKRLKNGKLYCFDLDSDAINKLVEDWKQHGIDRLNIEIYNY